MKAFIERTIERVTDADPRVVPPGVKAQDIYARYLADRMVCRAGRRLTRTAFCRLMLHYGERHRTSKGSYYTPLRFKGEPITYAV